MSAGSAGSAVLLPGVTDRQAGWKLSLKTTSFSTWPSNFESLNFSDEWLHHLLPYSLSHTHRFTVYFVIWRSTAESKAKVRACSREEVALQTIISIDWRYWTMEIRKGFGFWRSWCMLNRWSCIVVHQQPRYRNRVFLFVWCHIWLIVFLFFNFYNYIVRFPTETTL